MFLEGYHLFLRPVMGRLLREGSQGVGIPDHGDVQLRGRGRRAPVSGGPTGARQGRTGKRFPAAGA